MGYFTDFELTVDPLPNADLDVSWERLVEKEVESLDEFESGNALTGWYGNSKWYEHDKDMLLLSKKFPGVVFTLIGYGEDRDDNWCKYYCDGLVQTESVDIVFPPFSYCKLQEPPETITQTDLANQSFSTADERLTAGRINFL